MFLTDPTSAFLSPRPEWTLSGAIVPLKRGPIHTVDQTTFRLIDGCWEADVVVRREEPEDVPDTRVVLRVTPDTLRRWREAGINPFLEAFAQLKEHLRNQARHHHLTALTLL